MSKIENNTQEQMEAYMQRTVEENLVQQEGRINGMIAPEFVRCSLEDKTVLMRYPMQYWQDRGDCNSDFHDDRSCGSQITP